MTAATPAPTPTSTGITRWQTPSLVAGIIGMVLTIAGWLLAADKADFYRAYLPSWMFWFQIAAGCLGVLCLQYVTGGEWGILIRRPLAAAARTMWLLAILFLPIIIGAHALYPWLDPNLVRAHEALQAKSGFLNFNFWVARTIFYFLIWIFWAWRLRVLSLSFAETRSPETELTRRKMSAAGLLMFVLTMTFCSVDWIMSLEPLWYSTMYGINFLVGAGLSAFAFVTFFLTRLAQTPAMGRILRPSHLRDLGNLMLAFVMFWAYTAFSEYLLMWYANLREEIPHYLVRQSGIWGVLALLVIVFHFFLPFGMLLMRAIKDRAGTIAIVTVIVLAIRYVATYWLIGPSYYEHFRYSWIGLTSLVGIGGLWLWAFITQLKGQSIIPVHETWVEEAIREGALNVNA
ncbi:MAG: hypothetical protein JWN02_53 [Acidobacteria bacterium]|nr:hypothetical protein [Acidobacteriota bacterium]